MNVSSPEKQTLFRQAYELANAGQWQAALQTYNQVFDYGANPPAGAPASVLDSNLIGLTEIYKADCLRMLGRLEEAKQRLEHPVLLDCVRRFSDLSGLYQYFLIYGHVLGLMGKLDEMDDKLNRALAIAANELQDAGKCEECWQTLLYYAREQGAWRYCLHKAQEARDFAVASNLGVLNYRAHEFIAYAYQGLNDLVRAKEVGLKNLEMSRLYKAPDAVARWEAFLAGL